MPTWLCKFLENLISLYAEWIALRIKERNLERLYREAHVPIKLSASTTDPRYATVRQMRKWKWQ